jgi:hypothetical protein
VDESVQPSYRNRPGGVALERPRTNGWTDGVGYFARFLQPNPAVAVSAAVRRSNVEA